MHAFTRKLSVIAIAIGSFLAIALIAPSHASADVVRCDPASVSMAPFTTRVQGLGSAHCNYPSTQTVTARLTMTRDGLLIASSVRTCSPGSYSKYLSGVGICTAPGVNGTRIAGQHSYCTGLSITWRNQAGDYLRSASSSACATY